MDQQLQSCDTARAALAGQIQTVLTAAETGHQPLHPGQALSLILRARRLINDAGRLAAGGTPTSGSVCG